MGRFEYEEALPSCFSLVVRAIALIRQRSGIRSLTKDRVVQLGAIHKPRTWDTRHSARPIRDVPCATLRAFAAEVERKPALYSERLEKLSSS